MEKIGNAFFEKSSWKHRVKILQEDGSVKYGKIGGFATPEEANESYDRYEEEFNRRQRAKILEKQNKKESMLKGYLVYWFEDIFSERIEATTKRVQAYVLYQLILPNIEYDIKMRYVNGEYLDNLLEKINVITPSAGYSARTTLHMAFKDAVVEGFISRNPVPDSKVYARKQPKVVIYNKAQLKVFLKQAASDGWYLEYLLGVFLGLRKGEILGLKFSDFDLKRGVVKISRQLAQNPKTERGGIVSSCEMVEKQPKTENSYRSLRVPKIIIEELDNRRRQIERNKLACGSDYEDHDYISCQANGKGHAASAMNTALSKVCKRGGLPKITVHSLRHMFATILLEQGLPLVKISACLGHSSINTTFEYYCDVMDADSKVVDFMNDSFMMGA